MKLIKYLEARHERRTEAQVSLQAKAAAERIIKSIDEGVPPPYRFNANHSPVTVKQDNFSRMVGERAVALVGAEINCPVAYDHEASQQASTEFYAITAKQAASNTLPKAPDTILVFSEAQAA